MGIIFLVAISILVFMGYRYITQGLNPIDAESEEVIEIEIPSGSTRRDIANILEKNELINSSLIFDFYVRFSRSEERRVGKECRWRWTAGHEQEQSADDQQVIQNQEDE